MSESRFAGLQDIQDGRIKQDWESILKSNNPQNPDPDKIIK